MSFGRLWLGILDTINLEARAGLFIYLEASRILNVIPLANDDLPYDTENTKRRKRFNLLTADRRGSAKKLLITIDLFYIDLSNLFCVCGLLHASLLIQQFIDARKTAPEDQCSHWT